MSEWIYFIHPPREDFAATMTEEEIAVWGVHFERFQRLLAEGTIILVGPTLGRTNTGITILEAPDEAAARKLMEEDPVIAGGFATARAAPDAGLAPARAGRWPALAAARRRHRRLRRSTTSPVSRGRRTPRGTAP